MLHLFASLARLIILSLLSQAVFASAQPDKMFIRWIKKAMQENQVPAVSIVVIHDYKIDWVVGFGVSNVLTEQRIDDATLFQAGSISKPVTAMAALKAVQDGKLDLDTDINHYLTGWKLPQNFYTEAEKVTLRYLLSHCAGINVSGFLGYANGEPLPDLTEVLNGSPPSNSPPIRVVNEPGDSLSYSGGGYTVIQAALVDVYRQPFSTLMSQLILQPLSMTNSTFEQPLPAKLYEQIAKPYRPDYESVPGGPHTYVEEAAAGLWTTPFDLAKFTISIQEALRGDPYQILTPENAELMVDPEIATHGIRIYNKCR